MRLYFTRHGESEANTRRIYVNRAEGFPLTETGVRQADALAESLVGAGIARIFTSPLIRAVQTAEIVAARLRIAAVTPDEGLREFDVGDYEMQEYTPESSAQFEETMRRGLIDGDLGARVGGGESQRDIERRFLPFIEHVLSEDGDALLVSHGGVFAAGLPLVLANVAPEFAFRRRLRNTEVVIAEVIGGELRCVRFGDVEFD